MSNLRSLVFNSDPKKIPEVVDVFREDLLQKKNDYLGKDPIRQAATNYLKQEGIDADKLLSGLTMRADQYLDGASEKFNSIRRQLEKSFDLPNIDRFLSDIEKSELVQAVQNFDGLDKVKVIYNDVERYVSDQIDAVNVAPMLEMVNSVIGKTSNALVSFVDEVGQSALVQGLTASLLAWRVPELIELLVDSMEDDDAKGDIWQENAIRSANMGDLEQAERYIERLGPTRSRTVETELIRGLLSSYRRPQTETRSIKTMGQILLAYCARVNPNWDVLPNGITTIEPYLGISEDAYTALTYTDRWSVAAAAREVRVTSFDDLYNQLFPQFKKVLL